MKKNLFKVFLLILSIFLLLNCSTDHEAINAEAAHDQGTKGNKTVLIKGKEAINIFNKLNESLQRSFKNKSVTGIKNIGTIDNREVLTYTDATGIINYTFRIFNNPNDNNNTFHNLVLTEKGSFQEIHLIKYETSNIISTSKTKNTNNFELARMTTVSLSDSSNPCDNNTIEIPPSPSTPGSGAGGSGSSGGGTSSGGSSGSSGGGSGGTSCYETSLNLTCGDCNRSYSDWKSYTTSVCGNGTYDLTIRVIRTLVASCRSSETPCNVDGTIPVLPPVEEDVDLLYQLIVDQSLKNNPCLNSVYTQLGKAPKFQNYIQNFDGNFSVANLKLTASDQLPNNINAETSAPDNYLVTISFNTNNLNRPALSIARTFIHELILAEIFRKLLSVSGGPSVSFTQSQLIDLKIVIPGYMIIT